MRGTQDHARMLFEGFHRVVGIVLAAHCQQDASLIKVQQRSLQFLKRGSWIFSSQPDASHAIFANDASPESVIQIDDQRFCDPARHRMKESHPLRCEVPEVTRSDRKSHSEPFALVVPLLAAMLCHQAVVVEY